MQNEKSNLRNWFVIFSLATLLAGCASPPPALPTIADADAKSFAVKDMMGTLYIYDEMAPIPTRNFPVVIDTQISGHLGKGCYMVLDLKPGNYTVSSVGGAQNPEFDLSVEAGRIYFLKQIQNWSWGSTGGGGGARYEQASTEEGKKEVLKRKRVSAKFRL